MDIRYRILFLTNLYPGPDRPGFGAFVANQAGALRRRGHEVEVLHVEGTRSRWEYLRGIPRLRRALRTGRFDIIHAHYGLTGLLGPFRFPSRRRVPLVLSLQGSDLLWRRERPWTRLAARCADFTLVMSREMRDLLALRNVCVVPNGTDLTVFHPIPQAEARARLGWDPEEFVVLFPADPGRAVKNFPLAEAATAIARGRGAPELRLVPSFGRSQEEHNLRLNAADACLVTSHWEGSPNSVREALAVGLPVVAVPCGDAADLLEGLPECALRPREAAELAEPLLALARTRRAQGATTRHGGRARVEAFSSDRVAEALTRVYRHVLAGERDGARLQAEVWPVDRGWASSPASAARTMGGT